MRLLADDVLELDVPEHLRGYELVNGELVEVEVPSAAHGRLQSRLSHLLLSYIEAQGIDGEVYSETGFVLGSSTTRSGSACLMSRSSAARRCARTAASRGATSGALPTW